MRLDELDGTFLKRMPDGSIRQTGDVRDDADGLMFLCPKCHVADIKHYIVYWFKEGERLATGRTLDSLTLIPPMIHAECGWYGSVMGGDAT